MFGAQGEAPARREVIGAIVFWQDADNGRESRLGEAFFKRPEHGLEFRSPHHNEPLRDEPERTKPCRVDAAVVERPMSRAGPDQKAGARPGDMGRRPQGEPQRGGKVAMSCRKKLMKSPSIERWQSGFPNLSKGCGRAVRRKPLPFGDPPSKGLEDVFSVGGVHDGGSGYKGEHAMNK